MNLTKLISILLISSFSVFSQDIGTTQIKVVEGFKPSIPQVSRLNENATFADTIKKDIIQTYEVINANLDSDYKTKPLAVAQVKGDKIPPLYSTQVGLGFGNAFVTKANIVHNSKRSKFLSYGVVANHFANKYSPYQYLAKNSKNSIHLYGKKIRASYIFIANFDYDRRTGLYYNEKINLEEEKFFRNRFAYTRLSFSAISKETSPEKLKHHTTFFVSDLNEFSENQIYLSSILSKKINGLPYKMTIEFNDYLRYNNSKDLNNTDFKILSLSPATSFKRFGFDVDFGFDSDFTFDNSPFSFFPKIKIAKELVKGVLLIYCGLDHTQQQQTLKLLSDANPYIHSFGTNQSILGDSAFLQELKITDSQKLYLGMRNVLSMGEVFEGSISYGKVANFDYFEGIDHYGYNRFQVTYIDVKQLHAHANYSKEINEIISLNANAESFNWDGDI